MILILWLPYLIWGPSIAPFVPTTLPSWGLGSRRVIWLVSVGRCWSCWCVIGKPRLWMALKVPSVLPQGFSLLPGRNHCSKEVGKHLVFAVCLFVCLSVLRLLSSLVSYIKTVCIWIVGKKASTSFVWGSISDKLAWFPRAFFFFSILYVHTLPTDPCITNNHTCFPHPTFLPDAKYALRPCGCKLLGCTTQSHSSAPSLVITEPG